PAVAVAMRQIRPATARSERERHAHTEEIIALRRGFEITAVARIHDHGADAGPIEEVVHARKFVELPRSDPLVESGFQSGYQSASGGLRIPVVDVNTAAPPGIGERVKAERRIFPLQGAVQRR